MALPFSFVQKYQPEMAGVERAKKALWALLRSYDARSSAKLTISTEKGKLKVVLEQSFDQHSNVQTKAPRRISPSQLRRKERRAADPAVRQRAAAHQAAGEAAVLPSPEKVRSNSSFNSLVITSPVMDDVREEVSEEEVVEKRHLIAVPPDFEDRANNDYYHDLEKVDKVVKILGETDKCCFCEYDCPSPSEQEEKDRESGFGILDSLWDHIEQSHPLAYEWIS